MKRLMLIDDEPHVLSALKRMLSRAFHNEELTIETFDDPYAALARGREVAFDAVLSDFRMPIMDGVAFLKQFRQLQPDTPRLILSATTDFDTLMEAVNEAEIRRYLMKPWADEELVSTIRDALEHYARISRDRALVDQMRVSQGMMSDEEKERRRLETLEPGITEVRRTSDGSIMFDDI